MRIVTRPDFDGVVCAALIQSVENITAPTNWVQPGQMQKKEVEILEGDIIANLPYGKGCAMWFDHHFTNPVEEPFEGLFRIAPSAAGLVYEYYQNRLSGDYEELVAATDMIDAARLSEKQIRFPESDPYVLLSMTISGREPADEPYWNRLTDLLETENIETVMGVPEIEKRCQAVVAQNKAYEAVLKQNTRIEEQVAITDLRHYDPAPRGNRFLVYALYPKAVVSVTIRCDGSKKEQTILSIGHSVLNPGCQVNAGLLLSQFEGGGHRGAAACRFASHKSDIYIPKIINVLKENQSREVT